MRKIAFYLLALIALIAIGIAVMLAVVSETKPTGMPGPEADALARKMVEWTNPDGWAETGAVRWNFADRQQHLWDRRRGYSEVRWGGHVVQVRLSDRAGVAMSDGQPVEGDEGQRLIERAYGHWINDSFWLHPFDGLFDSGVERAIVERPDGPPALLVTYTSGGLTPSDSYLWLVGDDGQPTAWKMWVSIIPVGGLEASWEDWQPLSTGAKVSTLHRSIIDLQLKDVEGAATLETLVGSTEDPFAPLEASLEPAAPETAPASRPAHQSASQPATDTETDSTAGDSIGGPSR